MIKVLIIDDSATVRMILSKGLALDPEIQVVGVAPDPYIARDMIAKLAPDVLTLDVEMPRMDGLEFLQRVMGSYPMPVIMVSALTERGKQVTLEALEAGAVDYVTKPSGSHGATGLNEMITALAHKIKIASRANLRIIRRNLSMLSSKYLTCADVSGNKSSNLSGDNSDKIIAIGASTGGTVAIRELLGQFSVASPGIVLVQHITSGFSKMFAERLNEFTELTVKEAEHGDKVVCGRVLVAPSNVHMTIRRSGSTYIVDCLPGELVCGHCPSVEMLFRSVAKSAGTKAVGVILTGMGNDGAEGLLAMRDAGAVTIGQDEASCIVFGMPKVAWELGGVQKLLPLDGIVPEIIRSLAKSEKIIY